MAVVPLQRRRAARHERPARRPLPAFAVDAAPLLHRDADGRDPEPDQQRRRRCAIGRDRYGGVAPLELRDGRHDHRRDGDPRLAAHRPQPRPDAGVRVHHVPRRQGPTRGEHADPALDGGDERHHGGVAQRVGDPAEQDLRPAGGEYRALPRRVAAPRRPPGSRPDDRTLVLRADRHVLQHHAGVRLPRGRHLHHRRRPERVDRDDRRVHDAPVAAVLPVGPAAQRAGRDPGRAGAVRPHLRIPRDGARDHRRARRHRTDAGVRARRGRPRPRLVPVSGRARTDRGRRGGRRGRGGGPGRADRHPAVRPVRHLVLRAARAAGRARRAVGLRQDDDHVPHPAAL